MRKYMLRNMGFLDAFVQNNCSREKITCWLNAKKPAVCDKPPASVYLKYSSIDYLNDYNTKSHFTDEYENKDLVLRRSTAFKWKIEFKNRDYDKTKDQIFFKFKIGDSPSQHDGTLVYIKLDEMKPANEWSCTSMPAGQNTIEVIINIPKDAIIGRYKVSMDIDSEAGDGKVQSRKYTLGDIIVIFNPFSRSDDVYMENEVERKEYVMRDTGHLYRGIPESPSRLAWTYGQFELNVLDIALRLLKEGKNAKANPMKSLKMCKSPVHVARMLTAMVNDTDDNGVLEGRWDNNYEEGKHPGLWNGSVAILRKWNSENKPVKYGQCWVFSGVLTTVLRALGIPARSVTNFNSAHDTEYNMSIDYFIYSNGDASDKTRSGDSVWNFHVWNDAWMKRSDLPYTGYDGWQSVDATPQEPSSGIYQCGPAPLTAIKNGEVNIGYDTGFIFGEVNADQSLFMVDENEKVLKLVKKITNHCGRNISTDKPGQPDACLDITDQYKHREGTTEEREAYERAKLRGKLADWHKDFKIKKEGDIRISIESDKHSLISSENAVFTVKVSNHTCEQKECEINTRIDSMMYCGKRLHGIKQTKLVKVLQPNECHQFTIESCFMEHGFLLDELPLLRCVTFVKVDDDMYVDSLDLVAKHPRCLELNLPSGQNVKAGVIDLNYRITNKFPVQLNNFILKLEGKGVYEEIKLGKSVAPGKVIEGQVEFLANRTGSIKVASNLCANEVNNITKSFEINVST